MTDKPERLCRTCAWGDPHFVHGKALAVLPPPKNVVPITCHHEPIPVRNRPDYWCRHWAKTKPRHQFPTWIGPGTVTKEDFKE